MKITLSRYAGFCDGVARAFEIVEKIAQDKKTKRPIFVLGSLVHNNDVVNKIESWGVKKIDLEGLKKSSSKKIGTLVITAHGVGPKIFALLKKKKIDFIDTTCPRVIKVQRLAKIFFDRGYQIVIVGEKDHKEVRGIQGWSGGKAQIIENKKELVRLELNSKKKIAVLSQTTQNKDFVDYAEGYIKQKYPQAEIVGTVCEATNDRQNEVKKMAKANDLMIIIGSPESANSNQLWKISKKTNSKSFFIERADSIQKKWFRNCQKIGVTAGASTPKWIIDEVISRLKKS